MLAPDGTLQVYPVAPPTAPMVYVFVELQTPVVCPVMLPGVAGKLFTVTEMALDVALPQEFVTTQS